MDKETLGKVFRVAFASVVLADGLKQLEPIDIDEIDELGRYVSLAKIEELLDSYHKTAYIPQKEDDDDQP